MTLQESSQKTRQGYFNIFVLQVPRVIRRGKSESHGHTYITTVALWVVLTDIMTNDSRCLRILKCAVFWLLNA